MDLINGLEWRYATKKFNPSKKIPTEDLDKLKKAIQLSASSYGLQLYKVLIVKDEEVKKKLHPVAMNQSQILDSDAVVIFCNYTDIKGDDIDEYIKIEAETRGLNVEDLKGKADYLKDNVLGLSQENKAIWTAKQTYIALGTLLAAASELKIDACPMEGFSNEGFNEVLGLDEKNLNAAVIATIGYRADDDDYGKQKKVRRPQENLFQEI